MVMRCRWGSQGAQTAPGYHHGARGIVPGAPAWQCGAAGVRRERNGTGLSPRCSGKRHITTLLASPLPFPRTNTNLPVAEGIVAVNSEDASRPLRVWVARRGKTIAYRGFLSPG